MGEVKTQGLILNSNKLNDNDKIFTILTRDYGKVTALSKGISSHKHKDFSALQNFCFSDMVLSKKTGMFYVSSASVNNNFFEIRNSVEQVSFATYICDLVRSVPDDFVFDEVYYNFILNTLFMISKAQKKCINGDIVEYLKIIKMIFEFKTVCNFGYMPNIDSCGFCNSKKNLKFFDVANGTTVCDDCHDEEGYSEYIGIDELCLRFLSFLCMDDYKKVFSVRPPENVIDKLSVIAEVYLQKCLEIYPMSLGYLKNLISGGKDE